MGDMFARSCPSTATNATNAASETPKITLPHMGGGEAAEMGVQWSLS